VDQTDEEGSEDNSSEEGGGFDTDEDDDDDNEISDDELDTHYADFYRNSSNKGEENGTSASRSTTAPTAMTRTTS
jgi:hypothetical protein